MKRLVVFCLFIFVLICSFLLFSRRTKNYELVYEDYGYNIKERFDKKENNYYFNLEKEGKSFDFVMHRKYSTKRKIVNKLDEVSKDDYTCVSINVFKEELPYICAKENNYVDGYMAKVVNKDENPNELRNVFKISVYNEDYDYYIWNGHGVSSILDNKEYNFLNNESYDNNLSYQLGTYLIVADYDSTREFNKFYVFDQKEKKVSEWTFDYKISFNSYFMGDVDDYVYLFDKKNKVQYKLNIEKSSITITSDSEGALYYNNSWDTIGLNKLVYNNIYFERTNLINYSINDKKVYYNYQLSDKHILFDEGEIDSFVDIRDNDAFYLKKDTLFRYNVKTGKTKLLSYFEWNFSSSNKIFIFD